jgi:hypothetical protein
VHEEPAEVAAGVLFLVVLGVGALVLCIVQRRRLREQLAKLEREVAGAREQRQMAARPCHGSNGRRACACGRAACTPLRAPRCAAARRETRTALAQD